MAALTTLTTIQPATIKGMGGSSLSGRKLFIKPIPQKTARTHARPGAIVAKYGDKSVYFDLEDIGNTTGQWDLHSLSWNSKELCILLHMLALLLMLVEAEKHMSFFNVPLEMEMQSKFFETFAAPFTKRGLLLKFLLLGGGSTLAYLSATASGDVLPIKKGPQLPRELGPRGKL
ncbi:hypothetical protein ACLOJK_020263 [Asimina triloba]